MSDITRRGDGHDAPHKCLRFFFDWPGQKCNPKLDNNKKRSVQHKCEACFLSGHAS